MAGVQEKSPAEASAGPLTVERFCGTESCFNPPNPANTPNSMQSGMAVTKPLIFGMDAERGEPRGFERKDKW